MDESPKSALSDAFVKQFKKTTAFKRNLFHLLALTGHFRGVKHLISSTSIPLLENQDNFGYNPLQCAFAVNNFDFIYEVESALRKRHPSLETVEFYLEYNSLLQWFDEWISNLPYHDRSVDAIEDDEMYSISNIIRNSHDIKDVKPDGTIVFTKMISPASSSTTTKNQEEKKAEEHEQEEEEEEEESQPKRAKRKSETKKDENENSRKKTKKN